MFSNNARLVFEYAFNMQAQGKKVKLERLEGMWICRLVKEKK